jgi:hypothetical protein
VYARHVAYGALSVCARMAKLLKVEDDRISTWLLAVQGISDAGFPKQLEAAANSPSAKKEIDRARLLFKNVESSVIMKIVLPIAVKLQP